MPVSVGCIAFVVCCEGRWALLAGAAGSQMGACEHTIQHRPTLLPH